VATVSFLNRQVLIRRTSQARAQPGAAWRTSSKGAWRCLERGCAGFAPLFMPSPPLREAERNSSMKTRWTVKSNSLKTLALLVAGGLATQLASGQCIAPPPGLVAWWPGDNSTADYASTNQGILRNGASFGTGKVDQAFALPGMDSYVEFPALATLLCTTAITVEAWINPSSSSGTIVSQYNTHRGTWRFGILTQCREAEFQCHSGWHTVRHNS
jgi:hypothetical protein